MLWSFRRKEFIERFPDSLIASTLELDRKESTIVIDQPFVNPTVISILWIISERCGDFDPYLEMLNPAIEDDRIRQGIVESARYLLIDELGLFGAPVILDVLRDYKYNRLVHPTGETYQYLADLAIKSGFREYLNYLFGFVPEEQVVPQDSGLFFDAIFSGQLPMLQDFVRKRHIDPATVTYNQGLYNQLGLPLYGWVELLPVYEPNELEETSQSLMAAVITENSSIIAGNQSIVQWLLTDPAVQDGHGLILGQAARLGNFPIVKILLDHFDYNGGMDYLIDDVIFSDERGEPDVKFGRSVLQALLQDPRYRTETMYLILRDIEPEQVEPYLKGLDATLIQELIDVYHTRSNPYTTMYNPKVISELYRIL